MPKKDDESYLEYKKRIMDPISGSFCAAKWLNATIWLTNGKTTSCHHPPAHSINLDELSENPSAIHNTKIKKLERQEMLSGIRPRDCDYCWTVEDIKRDNISDRIFKTIIYEDEDIKAIGQAPAEVNVNLKNLEIAFDRNCNFACAYCNPSFSTTWESEYQKFGNYENLSSAGGRIYQTDRRNDFKYPDNALNPYIKAFWQWWPELSKDLRELRITGGEPLLSPELWKLFDYLIEQQSDNLTFAVNSNLGVNDQLIDRFIEKSKKIKNLDLYTSCESFGEQAEYVRDGLNFEKFIYNFEKIAKHSNLRSMNMMMTINLLCLFSLPEFLDVIMDLKGKYGSQFPIISLNILRFPSFMSVTTLSDELKKDRQKALVQWLRKNEDSKLLVEFEITSIRRLIDYLDVIEATPEDRDSKLIKQKDFKSFFTQYDQRRNKDFTKVFPENLVSWYQAINSN